MQVTNWGQYPWIEADLIEPKTLASMKITLSTANPLIARGNGRCYGDASLGRRIVSTLSLHHLQNFDSKNGTVTCEAGTTLAELLDVFVPRGYFLQVVPGTKEITVGGAIASDVHGKNHHLVGSFRNSVVCFDLLLETGEIATCSRNENSELFQATCGGMGLTGIILNATLSLTKISSAYIDQKSHRATNLEAMMELFERLSQAPFSVAWLDCLAEKNEIGRGILYQGDFRSGSSGLKASLDDPLRIPRPRTFRVPFHPPQSILTRSTMKVFNTVMFNRHHDRPMTSTKTYDAFFFPLDLFRDWNKLYGRNGFTQYQFVLPKERSARGIRLILDEIRASGFSPFLAILKLFGPGNGMLSFPIEGYTVALDFPIGKGLFSFLDRLDRIVIAHAGRIYLAKDVRMPAAVFKAGYPELGRFLSIKRQVDKNDHFRSLLSDRLQIRSKN